MGDGTYFHSGLLSIRACVAAKVNITFKVLVNGAVAMTGSGFSCGCSTVPVAGFVLSPAVTDSVLVVCFVPQPATKPIMTNEHT